MYISMKDKLGYINGDLPEPPQMDPTFQWQRTKNAILKGWLISSMNPSLIGNFNRFPTAKAIWDAIASSYFDGSDTSQVYDIRRRVSRLKQRGGSFEKYYNDLQEFWLEIDFPRPHPNIKHCNDICSRGSSLCVFGWNGWSIGQHPKQHFADVAFSYCRVCLCSCL